MSRKVKRIPTKKEIKIANLAHKNLMSAIFKFKQAINNKNISGLLITEAEIASVLLALGAFSNEE